MDRREQSKHLCGKVVPARPTHQRRACRIRAKAASGKQGVFSKVCSSSSGSGAADTSSPGRCRRPFKKQQPAAPGLGFFQETSRPRGTPPSGDHNRLRQHAPHRSDRGEVGPFASARFTIASLQPVTSSCMDSKRPPEIRLVHPCDQILSLQRPGDRSPRHDVMAKPAIPALGAPELRSGVRSRRRLQRGFRPVRR